MRFFFARLRDDVLQERVLVRRGILVCLWRCGFHGFACIGLEFSHFKRRLRKQFADALLHFCDEARYLGHRELHLVADQKVHNIHGYDEYLFKGDGRVEKEGHELGKTQIERAREVLQAVRDGHQV